MARKPFFRWVPKTAADAAIENGIIAHNHSAMWIFDPQQPYRPTMTQNAFLIVFEFDEIATQKLLNPEGFKNFEDDDFKGEGAHDRQVIIKANEQGAYGMGVLRQHWSRWHIKARYATRKEVAKALGVREIEVSDSYRPGTVWPK